MTTLTLEHLHYQRNNFSLNAHLTLSAERRYLLHAPSGSGKSTFLDLLAGFLTPQKGHIYLNQTPITHQSVEQRPISYLFQHHNLFDHLSAQKNLQLAHPNLSTEQLRQALEHVDLPTNYLKKYPNELSGGEQQRLALARTLLLNRPIILLDEPYAALDLATRLRIIDLTTSLQRQHQWLLIAVSHDRHDIERLDAQPLTIDNHHIITTT